MSKMSKDRKYPWHSASRPVGTPLEIERRYLLRNEPDFKGRGELSYIIQMYAPGSPTRRIRAEQPSSTAATNFYLTTKWPTGRVKNGVPLVFEQEGIVTQQQFLSLMRQCETWIGKTRTVVNYKGFKFEIDHIFNPNLYIVEVELPSTSTKFEMPTWIKKYVASEITGVGQLSNRALSRPLRQVDVTRISAAVRNGQYLSGIARPR